MFNNTAKRNAKSFIELSLLNQVDKLVILKEVRSIYSSFDTLAYIKEKLSTSSFINTARNDLSSRVKGSTDVDFIIEEVRKFNMYFNRTIDYRHELAYQLPAFTGRNGTQQKEIANLKHWLAEVLIQYEYIDDNTLTYAFKSNIINTGWNYNFNVILDNCKASIITDGSYIANKISKYSLSDRKMPLKEYDSIIQRYSSYIDQNTIKKLSEILEK